MTNIVNYCKNPSFEVNVTDDWTFSESGAGGSANLDATQYKVGAKSLRLRAGNNYVRVISNAGVSVGNGVKITISGWVRCLADPVGGPLGHYVWLIVWDGTTNQGVAYASIAAVGAWEYLTASWTNSGAAVTCYAKYGNFFNDSAQDVWLDACQLELAAAASPYTDGAQGEGHSWAGTAHNSVSTWTEPAAGPSASISPYMMV